MRSRSCRALVLAALGLLATATVSLAAGAIKGATYAGATVHGKAALTLRVSRNGKSVTVSLPFAPLYCEGGGAAVKQITAPARIAKDGTFKASISYEFQPTHRTTARAFFKGKFSGRSAKGTVSSEFPLAPKCSGSTSFAAKSK